MPVVVTRIVGAAEVAAQQTVTRIAHLLDPPHNAPHRHPHQHERVRREHQAALDNLRDDLRRAGCEQLFQIGIVDRAHDDGQRRFELMHVVQHTQRRGRVRVGNGHRRRAVNTGGDERFTPCRVAEHDRLARRGRGGDAVRIEVERDV